MKKKKSCTCFFFLLSDTQKQYIDAIKSAGGIKSELVSAGFQDKQKQKGLELNISTVCNDTDCANVDPNNSDVSCMGCSGTYHHFFFDYCQFL